ncbi:ribonucleoside-diphosphate reductase alpha chain [Candidatus Kinetoplastibacterium desouzaii TCC079E]|uniref:Ribonucleoside-diphosphate reductase n=1 Tax=Candidatus Kinetoplastidibacterium desouzai TCC079E TaxID=1208919 RepID=M1LN71_9PROT|nr:ribonucleoside-diphosphate reductase subunit alpha [Candidatus Kinetoplastibacterium desouzaii]AGF47162.1 ribonucleoside-diphosphate reductase alpha chain [Candidatus Kinetoplastibacterium desouzaii TCC079E]
MHNKTNIIIDINHQEDPLPSLNNDNERWLKYKIIRRNGSIVSFAPYKISTAITKAFIAVRNEQISLSIGDRELIEKLTFQVINALTRNKSDTAIFHIEDVQDHVELSLMRSGLHDVARAYVLYREKRNQARAIELSNIQKEQEFEFPTINILENGKKHKLDINRLKSIIQSAYNGFEHKLDLKDIIKDTLKNLYDGIHINEVFKSIIFTTRARIEKDPDYNYITARLLLNTIIKEVIGEDIVSSDLNTQYKKYFPEFIEKGLESGLLAPEMSTYDLNKLGSVLDYKKDLKFKYLGLQTLYDRYFLHIDGKRIELPQIFFMRVAMGIAINEPQKDDKAIEFYEILSSFDFMSSTPTLFNSGTKHSQMSSCYLTTVPDNLIGIYDAIKENALLAKYAGGLGNDWTPVRALRSHIKGTNGESQGVVPFLKVVNDTAVAVNQGGKRKGAVCTYLETWHLDIEEFLELRKNTGDERRRTHDMNTANWIPDLFMKRVHENLDWTLFSPSDCPDLHEKYGKEFEIAYIQYENKTTTGEIKLFKKLPAVTLWRKMLSMLFETGHPWITFKDPCNIRSPQQHDGIIHSSNLCTEITLNTNNNEIAVCNLGSINLVNHLKKSNNGYFYLDVEKIQKTITTAMRMLDNIIDINYYAVSKAEISNRKHRPVGLGLMGFQDCLHLMRIPYSSQEAVDFSDKSTEILCYYSYLASSNLSKERGSYNSYNGSLWSKGIMPHDTLKTLLDEREGYLDVDVSSSLDWDYLRNNIKKYGMRNSNCVAIAPTATISNIIGVSASIEPNFQNLYVKSNLSGEFTIINEYLVEDLKKLGLWDQVTIADLKYFDGSLAKIDRIPASIKELYNTAFEIEPEWLIHCASRRQKWIDQAQSLNIYMSGVSGKKLDEIYKLAWIKGLKTTYYLRTLAATSAEKSTGKGGELNSVRADISHITSPNNKNISCPINRSDDSECEVCQ